MRGGEAGWSGFESGLREVGPSGHDFCFDNETPRHRVWLDPFRIASHPVTHGDFIDFIEDGGYRRPELWLSAGWGAGTAGGWGGAPFWERPSHGRPVFFPPRGGPAGSQTPPFPLGLFLVRG